MRAEARATPEQLRDHVRALLVAHLDAAWLRHVGPTGTPAPWRPAEFLEVVGFSCFDEVSISPTWASTNPDGTTSGWSKSFGSYPPPAPLGVEEWWEWKLDGAGWNDVDGSTVEKLEDLGACLDDWSAVVLVRGKHDEKPPITDELVAALVLVVEQDR
jgi:hypothetical protein